MYKYKLGLLGCMAGFNQLFVEFKGALTEQFVCQKIKNGVGLLAYYYTNDWVSCKIDLW